MNSFHLTPIVLIWSRRYLLDREKMKRTTARWQYTKCSYTCTCKVTFHKYFLLIQSLIFADEIVYSGIFIKYTRVNNFNLWLQVLIVAYNLLSSTSNTAILSTCFVTLQWQGIMQFIYLFIYIHYLLRINTFSLTTILPCDPQYILKQHLHSIHINTQKFNTISKIMIANPTDHSLSNQRRAHGRIGVASQAPHTEFRQACGGYSCPNNMHLYPNLRGGAKAGSRCGPEQHLFKKSCHMAFTTWIKHKGYRR